MYKWLTLKSFTLQGLWWNWDQERKNKPHIPENIHNKAPHKVALNQMQ